jgi:hypothetical protein
VYIQGRAKYCSAWRLHYTFATATEKRQKGFMQDFFFLSKRGDSWLIHTTIFIAALSFAVRVHAGYDAVTTLHQIFSLHLVICSSALGNKTITSALLPFHVSMSA